MSMRSLFFLLIPFLAWVSAAVAAAGLGAVTPDMVKAVSDRLIEKHGEPHAARIRTGVTQVAARWGKDDGDSTEFGLFCEKNFLTDTVELAAAVDRLQFVLEQADGRLHEIRRMFQTPLDLDTGPVTRLDRTLADVDLQSHLDDDLFRTKTAFVALLNFPVHSLSQRLSFGPRWTRDDWARSRMMDRFDRHVPAAVGQRVTVAFNAADEYISSYNIRMDRIVTPSGEKPFAEEGLSLITHWGLRDELGSHYGQPGGLDKQRIIQKIMERIVRQEIPAVVVGNPEFSWCPETNKITALVPDEFPPDVAAPEPDTRYRRLLDIFKAVRQVDPYSPTAPTYIQRRFDINRQIPEAQVEKLLDRVLSSQEAQDLARRIPTLIGRPLEPFDIWYTGFKPRSGRPEAELDALVRQKYPTVASFKSALPSLLTGLGFSEEKARWLSDRIVVNPSRGAGHASGAVRREDLAHLRTRVKKDGMNYKGYNIAIHELGHNVEQVFSLNGIDHWFLSGVPNNAITEAFAFVFQERDLELLGLGREGDEARHAQALAALWSTYEIGGVALVDMKVWRWMYEHPEATPAELKQAVLSIARAVWNQYYAPVFGAKDQEILAIYSHMIVYGLYLPDYPLGHIVAFQVAGKMRSGNFGTEFERMAIQGRLTPDAWMRGAVGSPLSAEPLLNAARAALDAPR